MKYTAESDKSIEELKASFEKSVAANQFGILNTHHLKGIMEKKGFSLDKDCYVFDVCNPAQASRILSEDIQLSVLLPCRVSMFEDGPKTKISMIRPTALLNLVSGPDKLSLVAEEVEGVLIRIIDEAL